MTRPGQAADSHSSRPDASWPDMRSTRVGDFTVTAFADGVLRSSLAITVGVEAQEVSAATGQAADAEIFLSVNSFLIEGRGLRALIDAGAGETMGPTLGHLTANLREAGVAPESLTHVLLTHIHPDHANGLVDGQGRAHFPNAEVIVHETEAAFWCDRAPEDVSDEKIRLGVRRAHTALRSYGGRVRRVREGEVLPGVSALLCPGHTPGHCAYSIHDGADSLLVWGDLVHYAGLQLPRPDIGLVYDLDPARAALSRIRLLDRIAVERLRVGGMHLDYPGYARITRAAGAGPRYRLEDETPAA